MKKLVKRFGAWLSEVWEDMKRAPWAYALCGISIVVALAIYVLCMAGVLSEYILWNMFWAIVIFYAGDCFGHMVSKK